MKKYDWILKTKSHLELALALLFAMLVPNGASAGAILLDPSFGGDGIVTTLFGTGNDVARAVMLQPDGKILAAGYYSSTDYDFALARYNSDGSLDTSFGASGRRGADFSLHNDYGEALVLQPDGKIIVGGYAGNGSDTDFALVRYNGNGSADTSFGAGGKVTTSLGTYDAGYALALQPDSKIILAGSAFIPGDDDFALVRYNSDGSLDTTFGASGRVTTDFGNSSDDSGRAIALQPDGKIIVAGNTNTGSNSRFALVRYNSNGSLDTSFSGDGKTTTDLGGQYAFGYAVVIQPDGKIVVAGATGDGFFISDFVLVRYNSDGSLDTTFSADGKMTTDFGNGNASAAFALALQPDGKIIAAGSTGSNDRAFVLARYNGDGSPDVTFDGDGKLTTSVGGIDDGYALALQPDGKIIVAGTGSNDSNSDFALVRYLGDTATFADASTSYWAWNWIERLYAAGITGGCGASPLRYCPDASVSRAQMAVFLERAKNGAAYNPPTSNGSFFGDVPPSYWAAAWIEKLGTDGITSGCGSGNYCPENNVTRAEMAVFLLRAKYGAGYTPAAVGAGTGFSDVSTSYWAAAWIKQLAAEGVTGGCGAGLYCPETPVTRAQMAVFLVRTFHLP